MQAPLPEQYLRNALPASRYYLGAWLAVIHLFLSIPYAWRSLFTPNSAGVVFWILSIALTASYVYLLVSLRALLRTRFEQNGFDIHIYALIALVIAVTITVSLVPEQAAGISPMLVVLLTLLVAFGIVSILFGLKLKKLDLAYGHLNSFAVLNIIIGGMCATIVLAVVALFFGLLWDVVLARLFFRAADEVESLQGVQ